MSNKIWRVVDLLDWDNAIFSTAQHPKSEIRRRGIARTFARKKVGCNSISTLKCLSSRKHLAPFRELIKKRIEHTPVSYLTNRKEFMALNFYVDERVLIPRPETEQLVETVLTEKKWGFPTFIGTRNREWSHRYKPGSAPTRMGYYCNRHPPEPALAVAQKKMLKHTTAQHKSNFSLR